MNAVQTTKKAIPTGLTFFQSIAKQGERIDSNWRYPLFHERFGNSDFLVLEFVWVDDGVLQVVGDCANGHYEWVWFREDETVHFTRSGWGSTGRALLDGLKHAFGEVPSE